MAVKPPNALVFRQVRGPATRLGYKPNPPGALTTKQHLDAWAGSWSNPSRNVPTVKIKGWDGGLVGGPFHRDAIAAWISLNDVFKKHGYHIQDEAVWCWAYLRRLIRGSKRNFSTHGGAALDINAPSNPWSKLFTSDMAVAMVNEIIDMRTNNGKPVWVWGGHFGNNGGRYDAMHFQLGCTPADLATGIRGQENGAMLERIIKLEKELEALILRDKQQTRALIYELYESMLHRWPIDSEVNDWSAWANGSGSVEGMRKFIHNSPEAKGARAAGLTV